LKGRQEKGEEEGGRDRKAREEEGEERRCTFGIKPNKILNSDKILARSSSTHSGCSSPSSPFSVTWYWFGSGGAKWQRERCWMNVDFPGG
jgi:hypothetical protein